MTRRRIAIACQGGGSQCAFVAGVLRALFQRGVQHRYDLVGLSGTSGGALTAAVAWTGLLEQARGDRTPVESRVAGLWADLTAQTPQEIAFDSLCTQTERLVGLGWLPSVASSPSGPVFRWLTNAASTWLGRPEFTDLRALVAKHIDFAGLPSLVQPDSPVLLVGAGDILAGTFKVFTSLHGEIKIESLLASAAIPTLFPAVWVDGHAYWDGIFAANPPLVGFLRAALVGARKLPEEIWVVQVNPASFTEVPETADEIFDRRNHLAGNFSLQHELELIHIFNLLLREKGMTDSFRARFGFDTTEPVTVRFIRMSPELQRGLDYPTKLSRQPSHIARLMAEGEEQGAAFLAALTGTDQRVDVATANGPRPGAS